MNAVHLYEGSATIPLAVPIPEETCRFYHWLDVAGRLTEGAQAQLRLSNCDEDATVGTDDGAPLYFSSTTRQERDLSTYEDGSALTTRLHDFPRDGEHAIHVRVLYPNGDSTDYQRTVVIEDVAPTISRAGSRENSVDPGAVSTLIGSFVDPGVHDAHQVSVDWGDGSAPSSINLPAGLREFTASHVYPRSGHFTATVTVTDLEGTSSASSTAAFFVSGVVLQDGELNIIGTDEDDHVAIRVGDHRIEVVARLGELPGDRSRFSTSEVEGIELWAFSGDDRLRTDGHGTVAISVHGGMGDDEIATGRGNDRIIDLRGDNVIRSGRGDDTVISGAGDDRVSTGPGDDHIEDLGGDNRINTGCGDDTVLTGDGDDRVSTGSGDDRIEDTGGDNRIDSGRGDDTIFSGDGDDRVCTGPGDDRVVDTGGDNQIDSGGGDEDDGEHRGRGRERDRRGRRGRADRERTDRGDDRVEDGSRETGGHCGRGDDGRSGGDGDGRVGLDPDEDEAEDAGRD